MYLSSAVELRVGLGFDDMTDINDAILAALAATEVELSSALDTSFARATTSDIFYVEEPGWQSGNHRETEFRLRNGFITSINSIVKSSDFSTLDAGDAVTSYILTPAQGIVKDLGTLFAGEYVKINYTHGFTVSPSPNQLQYLPSDVPPSLQELSKVRAIIMLVDHPSMKAADVSIDSAMFQQQYETMLAAYRRYCPMGLNPF